VRDKASDWDNNEIQILRVPPNVKKIQVLMRVPEKYQKYRYAKKTQISLGPKKYRYVGDICSVKDKKCRAPAGSDLVIDSFSECRYFFGVLAFTSHAF
jgi:hypothetical protein